VYTILLNFIPVFFLDFIPFSHVSSLAFVGTLGKGKNKFTAVEGGFPTSIRIVISQNSEFGHLPVLHMQHHKLLLSLVLLFACFCMSYQNLCHPRTILNDIFKHQASSGSPLKLLKDLYLSDEIFAPTMQ